MLIRYGDSPQPSQLTLLCNTGEGGLFSNVSSACARGLPTIGEPAIVCGGGPSLEDSLETVRAIKAGGAKIFALNNAARFLYEHGIKADYQILIDPRPENVAFIDEAWARELLIASQCHPSLFDQAAKIGYPTTLWHPAIPGIDQHINNKDAIKVTCNITIGLSCLSLIYHMGHRNLHLFGYDSSHKADKSHAYRQAMNDADEIVRCAVDSQVFYASMAMAGQAAGFKEMLDMLEAHDCKIQVYGEGLLPTMWRSWQRERAERVLTAVYDLGVSPPTYDFLSFLIEAERHRRAHGYSSIDIVFQPGPIHGFRDDDLPPDAETRKGMLWRVCVGMARLLPSVRNIDVKQCRWHVTGDVFPVDYAQDQPKAHYATAYLKHGESMLKASEHARRLVAKAYSRPFATITLREAEYWPDRNSNRREWATVAAWLKSRGIQPVIVPDTAGTGLSAYGNFTECREAAIDIDMRAALYEQAVINLGVLNGPMSLCGWLKCRYLIFKIIVESAPATTKAFLTAHGFNDGDGFGGNGKLIWKPDTAANILAELVEFDVNLPETTSHAAAN